MASSESESSLLEGLQAQLASRAEHLADGAVHSGWKAGFGSEAAMLQLGTAGPLVGYLTDSTSIASGTTVDVSRWGKAILEPEVAVRLSGSPAVASSPAAAADSIDAVAAAVELVDLAGAAGAEASDILAANVFHRHYVVGEFMPVSDRSALERIRISVVDRTENIAADADPRDAVGDLAEVVLNLARLLDVAGEELREGDLIITGSAIPAIPLSGGERIEVGLADSRVFLRIASI